MVAPVSGSIVKVGRHIDRSQTAHSSRGAAKLEMMNDRES